jgi:L-rhamnose-H+ transport protein
MGTTLGVLLALMGGVMVGNSMVPIKYLRHWRWENAWIVFSLVALVILPWTLAFLRVPHLLAVYSAMDRNSFIMPFLFGAGWGIAQVLFGLAVVRIGMALAFAITIGLSAALGTLVPIMTKNWHVLATSRGHILLLGLLLMVIGVLCCSWAGQRRERERKGEANQLKQESPTAGILMAAVAGLLAPMLNYALAFGDVFILQAIKYQASAPDAPYAVWPIALVGGAIPNVAYAIYLARANRSWKYFSPSWPDILFAVTMGVLWMGSVAIYGTATTFLGALGASVGWSIFQICIIFTANISGWMAGEWTGVSRQSKFALWSGLFLLGSATLAISYGNH